jgi:TatA/E family protein of Tat protein translocase
MVLAGGPFGLGPLELGIILLVVVMLFGATRLADVGGSLGKGIREFRKNVKDEEEETKAPPPPAASPAPAATAAPISGPPQAVSALKCGNCGTLNPVNAKHCNECGSSIAAPVS